jgi:acyl dehydratase
VSVAARVFESIEFGEDLPELHPDVSLARVQRFSAAVGMAGNPRFTDHEAARRQGLPSAIVPGILSQALLASLVHRWAPGAQIRSIDTVFRAPVLVDSKPVCRGVVTHLDAPQRSVEVDLTILNEAGETRVLGTAVVRLP